MAFIRVVLLLLLGYFVRYLYKKLWKNNSAIGNKKNNNKSIKPEEMKQDPVCKTYVPVSQAKIYSDNGSNKYFCSDKCMNKYKKEVE